MNLRLALRTLLRSPIVTVVAIVSLALGIGTNVAIFSLFHQILLRPLPVDKPAELVNLVAPGPKPGSQSCNQAGGCDDVFSYPMFRDLERLQTSFTGFAAHRLFPANLAYRGQTLNGRGVFVSGRYFSTLGLQPALGRLLGPDDDAAVGGSPVVVLSHRYWRTRFDASPTVLDEPLIVDGQALTIVGVAPQGFDGTTLGALPEVFVPITLRSLLQPRYDDSWQNRRDYWVYAFARLAPGTIKAQAETAINVPYQAILAEVEAPLQKEMSDQTLARFKAKRLILADGRRGQSNVHREARTPLTLLLGVTAFVLLIACANIANLLLARGAARAGEIAVRLSLGASRRHLVGQLLLESVLLASLGGLLGLVAARWTLAAVLRLLPAEATSIIDQTLDSTVLAFTAGVAILTGLVFGLFPALHSTKSDLVSTLKDQAGQKGGSAAAARFRWGLATMQIALSLALLAAAGLFTRSLANVSRVDLGFRADQVVTFGLSPELNGYTADQSRALFERVEDALAQQPGVTGVTAGLVPLAGGDSWGSDVRVQGFEAGPDTDRSSRLNELGPDYFRTLGITVLAGREFTRADTLGTAKVAIVNEAFAKKFGLGQDAVGKRMSSGQRATELDTEIIGLVRNTKYSDVKQEPPPVFYRPYRQDEQLGGINFYVRTAADAEPLLQSLPRVVSALEPNLPLESPSTLPEQIRENVFLDRMIATLSSGFALLATLLAGVGLYGVLAYSVGQRTREIGLRMALGADRASVRGLILRQVAWMTLVGGAIGLPSAIGVGRLARSLLYGLDSYDPAALVAASGALVLVALSAGLVPAIRASRVDPITALLYE